MKKFKLSLILVKYGFVYLYSGFRKSRVSDEQASFLRLSKPTKCEFTVVNDHFEIKRKKKKAFFCRDYIKRKRTDVKPVLTLNQFVN